VTWDTKMTVVAEFDASPPSVARIYDYLLGGYFL
jgi:hypothetical protein